MIELEAVIVAIGAGEHRLRVTRKGAISVDGEEQPDLYSYEAELTLPEDPLDPRDRVVRKRVIHYAPHGWRRLLRLSISALL